LDNDPIKDDLKRSVFGYGLPPVPILRLLSGRQSGHRLAPGAGVEPRIRACQIGSGDLQVEHWLAERLVLRLDDLLASSWSVVPRLVRLPVVVSTQ